MSVYMHKSHNASVLLYHLVCPAKYRRGLFSKNVDKEIKKICVELGKRYQLHFLEIGTDEDHVHFLIQSVPVYQPTKIVRVVKSITAREMFKRKPEVKQMLWGGESWSDGYYISTVGKHNSEQVIADYVKNQGKEKEYIVIHKDQLSLDL